MWTASVLEDHHHATGLTACFAHAACRRKILRQYAKHLGDADIAALAAATERMSGRDLRDIAEQTERAWASRVGL